LLSPKTNITTKQLCIVIGWTDRWNCGRTTKGWDKTVEITPLQLINLPRWATMKAVGRHSRTISIIQLFQQVVQ